MKFLEERPHMLEAMPIHFLQTSFFNIVCPKCQMNFLRRDVINVTSLMLMAHGGAGQTLPAETMCCGNGAEVL